MMLIIISVLYLLLLISFFRKLIKYYYIYVHCRTRSYNNMSPAITPMQTSRTVPSPYQPLEDSTVIIEGSVTGGVNSEKYNTDQYYDFDESASIAPSDVDIRKYYKGRKSIYNNL